MTTSHEPLSATLTSIVANLPSESSITLNELFDRTGGRGPYALLVVLSLPFVTPVSLPGISNVFGVVMLIIIWKMLRGRPPHLPRFAGGRVLQRKNLERITRASARVLRIVEKIVKPRRSAWMNWRPVRLGNCLAVGLMALMLALPIPPTIPLSNTLPGYAIILLSFSIMEEDGALIWAAYVVTAGAFLYLVAMLILQAGAVVALYSKYFHRIIEWFH